MQTVKDSPMATEWPEEAQQQILHASLVRNGLVLLGSDTVLHDALVNGNTISISLHCSSLKEITTFFAKLSVGGLVVHPLHNFAAGIMGTLTDKFDKDWLLYFEKKEHKQHLFNQPTKNLYL